MKKLTWKTGGLYDSISYIDGIFEYRTDGTDEQNLLHIMDNRSRIAMIRIGDNFGDSAPAIQYNLEDNLGGSIMLLEDNGANINKEEYYPFGETSFGSYAEKRYKYCAKERDKESGLYYYGARYYSAWICKFVSVDPLAHDYMYLTPYNYAGNRPIISIDIDGMQGGENKKDSKSGDSKKQIPGGSATPTPEVHNVKKGETLSGIAKQHGTTVEKLRAANNLDPKNDKKLQIGTKLNVQEPIAPKKANLSNEKNNLSNSDSKYKDSNIKDFIIKNTGKTITHQTPTVIGLIDITTSLGDVYQLSGNMSNLSSDHKMINVNFTIVDNIKQLPDLSINLGPARLNLNPNGTGSMTASIGIGPVRTSHGISGDGIMTSSVTVRDTKLKGSTIAFSYRPGGWTGLAAAAVVVGVALPEILPAAGQLAPLIPLLRNLTNTIPQLKF